MIDLPSDAKNIIKCEPTALAAGSAETTSVPVTPVASAIGSVFAFPLRGEADETTPTALAAGFLLRADDNVEGLTP